MTRTDIETIRTDLAVLKGMVATNVAIALATLWRVFA